jgi:uncharacterized protein YneF (UPF0154 family)
MNDMGILVVLMPFIGVGLCVLVLNGFMIVSYIRQRRLSRWIHENPELAMRQLRKYHMIDPKRGTAGVDR